MCHRSTVGQASHLSTTVPSNTDVAQVPLNQPVSLFPSLLLPQTHLAAPLTAAAAISANQSNAECSTSANILLSLESSARQQQQQETRAGLQDCAKTKMVAKEPEPAVGNPERENRQPVADDKGNESDDSVEMIDRSNMEVIAVDESDCEDSRGKDLKVPAQPQEPSHSVNAEFSSASTQTSQQSQDDRWGSRFGSFQGSNPELYRKTDPFLSSLQWN